MKTYEISAKITITTYTSIEAESPESALEKAKQRHDMMSISSNNGDTPDEVWMIDDLDGEPYDIKIDK